MPFWRIYCHLVWTTKNREPLITPEIEPRLYAYLVHKAAELGAFVYAINGWTDHVHIIAAIPPHVSVSDLVKHLKGASSHDLNQQGLDSHFAWQRGYGVLTLGQRQRPDAVLYVQRQKEHHGADKAMPGWSGAPKSTKVPRICRHRPCRNECRPYESRRLAMMFWVNRHSSSAHQIP